MTHSWEAYELGIAEREIARLTVALKKIASQSTVGELEVAYGEGCTGDVEAAYDTIIGIARAALATEPAKAEEER